MATEPLPRSTGPEAQGIPSEAILDFVNAAKKSGLELHGLVLLRHGYVVAEGWWRPYAADRPHMLYSLSKSFTSTAAGLAVSEGRFSLADRVVSFFPDDLPAEVGENLAAMRVRDLLTMSTGHDREPALRMASDGNWARAFLTQPVEHEPGTHFLYNSGATYMVSAIVQKTTGETLLDYLGPRLMAPLGIVGATWESCPRGVHVGGWGLKIKTEDIARFGQLYLQKGVWNGERLLPEGWVEEATAKQVPNGDKPDSDWSEGYGYQFWRCRHGAYRGDGAFGQYCVVMPEQDAVVAINSGVGDMQAVLNLIWEHLLPATGPTPLADDPAAREKLTRRLAGLALPAPHGSPSSPEASRVSGRTYRLAPNDEKIETLRFDFGHDGCDLTIRDARGEHRIPVGGGEWRAGTTTFQPLTRDAQPTEATGAWTHKDTFVARVSYVETPFCPTFTFRFEEDRVLFDLYGNIGFGPKERPQMEGRLA